MKWWDEEKLIKELAEYFAKWGIRSWPAPDLVYSSTVFHRDNLRDILRKYVDA